jgi:DNA-binding NtrC family response regulator
MRRALSGHDVVDVGTMEEAIALLDAGERFDVILTDVAMPRIDGPAFVDIVRERRPDLLERVVFVTGGPKTPEMIEFLRDTTIPIVQKPFASARLREIVLEVGKHEAAAARVSNG